MEVTTKKATGNGAGILSKAKSDKKGIMEILNSEGMKKQFAAALPKHIESERFVRIALTQLRQNPALMQCSPESLLGALMQSAQLGLEPGIMGQSYLIPFKNNKLGTTECQFQIGYKGLIELARRSGQIETIVANEVCENDTFEYEYGFEEKLVHKPMIKGERGQSYAYYAYATLKDGGRSFVVMSKADIDRIRTTYSKAKYGSPWETEYNAMAKKTVIKQLMKYLPVSIELIEKFNADETQKVEVKAEKTGEIKVDVLDITPDYTVATEEPTQPTNEQYGAGGEIIEVKEVKEEKKEEKKEETKAEDIAKMFEQK